jgi:hypothetical protein
MHFQDENKFADQYGAAATLLCVTRETLSFRNGVNALMADEGQKTWQGFGSRSGKNLLSIQKDRGDLYR